MNNEIYNCYDIIISALGLLCTILGLLLHYKGKITIVSHKTAKKAKILEKKKSFINIPFFSIYKRSSFEEVKAIAELIANEIEKNKYYPTIIIGIGRGGAIFSSLLSYYLHYSHIFCIDRDYDWDEKDIRKRKVNAFFDFVIPEEYLKRVLLVAGETHSGNTMEYFFTYLKNTLKAEEIKTCSYYKQSVCTFDIDYIGKIGEDTSLMPWQNADYIRDSLNREEGERQRIQKLLHNF